jgi:hypothetical protein
MGKVGLPECWDKMRHVRQLVTAFTSTGCRNLSLFLFINPKSITLHNTEITVKR